MSDNPLFDVRAQHSPITGGSICVACCAVWPCTSIRLAADHERIVAELRERAEKAEAEAELHRMQLAAIDVAAHGGSAEPCAPEYRTDALEAVEKLRARVAELEADGRRLEWVLTWLRPLDTRAQIDAAMAEEKA